MLDVVQIKNRSVEDLLIQIKQIVSDMRVYLTFNIDYLDPSFASATVILVIDGFTSDRAMKLVPGMQTLNIVGIGVVEVALSYDQSYITTLATANLDLESLYLQAAKKEV